MAVPTSAAAALDEHPRLQGHAPAHRPPLANIHLSLRLPHTNQCPLHAHFTSTSTPRPAPACRSGAGEHPDILARVLGGVWEVHPGRVGSCLPGAGPAAGRAVPAGGYCTALFCTCKGLRASCGAAVAATATTTSAPAAPAAAPAVFACRPHALTPSLLAPCPLPSLLAPTGAAPGPPHHAGGRPAGGSGGVRLWRGTLHPVQRVRAGANPLPARCAHARGRPARAAPACVSPRRACNRACR